MPNNKKIKIFKYLLSYAVLFMLGITAIIFSILYLQTFNTDIFYSNYNIVSCVVVSLISILTISYVTFYGVNLKILSKSAFLLIITIAIVSCFLYYAKTSGVLQKIDSIEKLRLYISSFKSSAVFLFILIQFLQVVILPIPGIITIGAGVLLFGWFKAFIYSFIGIFLGSLTAFFIGKIFGVKAVKWLIGETNFNKTINAINKKGKYLLSFMFIFPFFPDDLLCFVAGVSSISTKYFINLITITRLVSAFTSCFLLGGNVLPFTSTFGIIITIIIILLAVLLLIMLYKNYNKIERYLLPIFKNKK